MSQILSHHSEPLPGPAFYHYCMAKHIFHRIARTKFLGWYQPFGHLTWISPTCYDDPVQAQQELALSYTPYCRIGPIYLDNTSVEFVVSLRQSPPIHGYPGGGLEAAIRAPNEVDQECMVYEFESKTYQPLRLYEKDHHHFDILQQGIEVWNQWRLVYPEIIPNLRNASLEQIPLQRANLAKMNLTGVGLRSMELRSANLNEAVLESSDLTESTIIGSNLIAATLNGAILYDANFIGTDLSDADFTGAFFDNTILVDVNLSNARGLDTCSHRGPSIIDRNTLIKSGRLPFQFLRGCGMTDWEIEAIELYQPNLSPEKMIDVLNRIAEMRFEKAFQYYTCFISYSHNDEAFVIKLYDRLQERGIRCWLDKHSMRPGDDIEEEIARAIRLQDKVLLCCSKSSLKSWWVEDEVGKVFAKERQLQLERDQKVLVLIPLDLDGFLFSKEYVSGKAEQIKSRRVADLRGWEQDDTKFDAGFESIVQALRTIGGDRGIP